MEISQRERAVRGPHARAANGRTTRDEAGGGNARRFRALQRAYWKELGRVHELERQQAARADLTEIVSHDFMQAIGALRMYAVTLVRRWGDLEVAKRFEIVNWIEREAGRLREMADQVVMTMARDPGEASIRVRPEHAVELAREAADAMGDLGERLTVRIDPEAERVRVQADRAQIVPVLRNLLSNALKYSDPGTPIELRVSLEDDEVAFRVKDRGPGIAPEFIPFLFHRFTRAPSSIARRIPGSGLGLYSARTTVESHDGRIWADSRPNEGSTFCFTLPRWGAA